MLLTDDATDLRDRIRTDHAEYAGRFGAGIINGVLVARWLDRDAQSLRAAFGQTWKTLRHQALGLPAQLPRLWDI